METFITQQNINLELNLNSQAITPIAIPEQFIKTVLDEDPMEVIASLLDMKEGFLRYRILLVEGSNGTSLCEKASTKPNKL